MSKKSTKSVKSTKVASKASAKPKNLIAKGDAPKAAKSAKAAFENPYRFGGGYWATVEALRTLGVGKLHNFDAVIAAVKKAMGDKFKAFAAKDARNEATGKDAEARIIQNVSVVARKDYGKPLTDIGYRVYFNGREKNAGLMKVTTK